MFWISLCRQRKSDTSTSWSFLRGRSSIMIKKTRAEITEPWHVVYHFLVYVNESLFPIRTWKVRSVRKSLIHRNITICFLISSFRGLTVIICTSTSRLCGLSPVWGLRCNIDLLSLIKCISDPGVGSSADRGSTYWLQFRRPWWFRNSRRLSELWCFLVR
jgi:hypothetical protein